MADRLTRIVTRGGDRGSTGLADGSRRRKHDIRVHCLGEVDELNAVIGLCIAQIDDPASRDLLLRVQHDLFDIGAELSQPGVELFSTAHLEYIEQRAAAMNDTLEPLREFILPGGSPALAQLHLARTVCRRVERSMVRLHEAEGGNETTLAYLNRLSDLLFILARYFARQSDIGETCWRSEFSRLGPGIAGE